MLDLLFADTEGPGYVVTGRRGSRLKYLLAMPQTILSLALLIPFFLFAFTMTAVFGGTRE